MLWARVKCTVNLVSCNLANHLVRQLLISLFLPWGNSWREIWGCNQLNSGDLVYREAEQSLFVLKAIILKWILINQSGTSLGSRDILKKLQVHSVGAYDISKHLIAFNLILECLIYYIGNIFGLLTNRSFVGRFVAQSWSFQIVQWNRSSL